jgi:hypothetical protein
VPVFNGTLKEPRQNRMIRGRVAALSQNSIVRWASITTNHSTQLLHINVVKTA